MIVMHRMTLEEKDALTFNLSDGTQQDILLSLLILKCFQDFVDYGLCEFRLLALLNLLFITGPGVQNSFKLSSESDLLLQNKGLRLEFGRFLKTTLNMIQDVRRRATFEIAKRPLVTSTTSFISFTESMRSDIALVCSVLVDSRMSLTRYVAKGEQDIQI